MLTSTKSKNQVPTSDRLPEHLLSASCRERVRTTAFGGLDMGIGQAWGIAEMQNLSPRCAPALATRARRELLLPSPDEGAHHGMAVLGENLYIARGSHLYCVPQVLNNAQSLEALRIGSLSDTDKCMVVFGNRLLIWPDKVYVEDPKQETFPMELDMGVFEGLTFCGNTVTLPYNETWEEFGFFAGDSVHISETKGAVAAGYYRIQALDGSVATVTPAVSFPKYYGYEEELYEEILPEEIVAPARLQRHVPDMQGLAVMGDRLCGFNGRTVYIGGRGSPFAWWQISSDSQSPATLQSYTDGVFTACAARGDELVLFKHSSVARVTGTRSDNFVLSEISAAGVPKELSCTLCEMAGNLYYYSVDGAYVYGNTAQRPESLGRVLNGVPVGGCAVVYEEGYYLALEGGSSDGERESHRYLYSPAKNAWYEETDIPMIDGARLGAHLCSVDAHGDIWLSRTDGVRAYPLADEGREETLIRSFVSFVPDYSHHPDGCRPVALYLRATSDGVGELKVLLSFSDGRCGLYAHIPASTKDGRDWENVREVACISGNMRDRLLRIPLPPRRCDHVVLALEMQGDWVIHDVTLEYETPRH